MSALYSGQLGRDSLPPRAQQPHWPGRPPPPAHSRVTRESLTSQRAGSSLRELPCQPCTSYPLDPRRTAGVGRNRGRSRVALMRSAEPFARSRSSLMSPSPARPSSCQKRCTPTRVGRSRGSLTSSRFAGTQLCRRNAAPLRWCVRDARADRRRSELDQWRHRRAVGDQTRESGSNACGWPPVAAAWGWQ
jgi:hypothetical protein